MVDMRFAKVLRFAGTRSDVGIDLYNLFNNNAGTAFNRNFGADGATWLRPTAMPTPASSFQRDSQLLERSRVSGFVGPDHRRNKPIAPVGPYGPTISELFNPPSGNFSKTTEYRWKVFWR